MPAYVIGSLKVQDPSWMAEYGRRIMPLLAKHGGRYLARSGQIETLEGGAPLPSGLVVIEFPTIDAARAWYNDPEYVPLIQLRQTGSQAEIVLVAGV